MCWLLAFVATDLGRPCRAYLRANDILDRQNLCQPLIHSPPQPTFTTSKFSKLSDVFVGRDRLVGIATRYGLHGPGIESRWEARFSASVLTGTENHPASYIMGTGSFPRVKRPGRGIYHPTSSSSQVKERVQL